MPQQDAKRVRIIMSFGGNEPSEERRNALTYTVIKKIIERYETEKGLNLNIDRCIRYFGEITPAVLDEIARADVVVAVLDVVNPTVVFELAFRYTLRGQIILVVMDRNAIPFYLKDWAYVELSQQLSEALLREAKDTDNFPDLSFENCPLSPRLNTLLSSPDKCIHDLCKAIDKAIASDPLPSPYFETTVLPLLKKKLAPSDEGPERFWLGRWARAAYYPLSVLRVDFRGMSDIRNGRYDPENDLLGEPTIFDANRLFAKIFDIRFEPEENIPALLQRKALTFSSLMNRLIGANGKRLLTDPSWDVEAFKRDQEHLRRSVLFYYEEAATDLCHLRPSPKDLFAHEPIRLAEDHPVKEMCGESFLPCLIGKLHDGDFQGKHSVYIQIAYIDITQVSGLSPTLKGAPMG